MAFKVVIPARYASQRLPGKPLLEIAGKPMVAHVVAQAIASGADDVVVATDDVRIYEAMQTIGCQVVMTSSTHQSGTDRIAEVVKQLNWAVDEVVVNVQGDEPLIKPATIKAVASQFARADHFVAATACFKLDRVVDFVNPNNVKVVFDTQGKALYFSRAPIPFPRDKRDCLQQDTALSWDAYQHIGLYAYRVGFLDAYTQLSIAPMEQYESLEQLRILHHGYEMAVHIVDGRPEPGIDTPEDLARVRSHWQE